jgi:hypothetical protein
LFLADSQECQTTVVLRGRSGAIDIDEVSADTLSGRFHASLENEESISGSFRAPKCQGDGEYHDLTCTSTTH